jgi:prepilin-type N-terminal cleavage/methylation domain-containing protein
MAPFAAPSPGRRPRGFTLVEAVVAVAVAVILAGTLIPLAVNTLRSSQVTRARNDIQVVASALASQLKDTGVRPTSNVNGAFGTGEGDSYFFSTQAGIICPDLRRNWSYGGDTENNPWQVFLMLFGGLDTDTLSPWPNATQLFYGETTTRNRYTEFAWKGPYLGIDACQKTDPWGGRYYILGYNANGQTFNTPIWVISAGPDHRIQTSVNPVATSQGLPKVWTLVGLSADDIAVRVN